MLEKEVFCTRGTREAKKVLSILNKVKSELIVSIHIYCQDTSFFHSCHGG